MSVRLVHRNTIYSTRQPRIITKQGKYLKDGIHLAIQPLCDHLPALPMPQVRTVPAEINTGIDWRAMRDIVVFGDSFTQVGNGGDGSPPSDLKFLGKNPSAGGRATNGETWIEQLLRIEGTNLHDRRLFSYATNAHNLWDDFASQLKRFYVNASALHLHPDRTLYVGYFGINDFWSISADGDQMQRAGERAAKLVQDLHLHAGARNILWLGVQFSTPSTHAYNAAVFSKLHHLHKPSQSTRPTSPPVSSPPVVSHNSTPSRERSSDFDFAFIDTARFFDTIEESYPTFGYESVKHCLVGQQSSIEDECEDPTRTVYYLGAHPSKHTHRLLAEYIMLVLKRCQTVDDSYTSLYLHLHGSESSLLPWILLGMATAVSGILYKRRAVAGMFRGTSSIVLNSPARLQL